MNTERTNIGWGFWLAWVLASAVGFGIGPFLGAVFAYGLFPGDTFDATKGITFGMVMGATGGYLQWVVLRERVAGAGLWGLACALGFALALGPTAALGITAEYVMTGLLVVSVYGVAGGILQWLILRRKVPRAGWWLLANLLGSLVGTVVLPIAAAMDAAGKGDLGTMIFGLVFGAGNGAINGAALVWLLRQSPSGEVEGLAAAH